MRKDLPLITIILGLVNVVVFCFTYFHPEIIYTFGGNSYDEVMSGEWWRLFTCMFIHFSLSHLFNNMLSLFAIGSTLEPQIGKIKYLAVYLVTGLASGIGSLLIFHSQGELTISAGASGAICGILGFYIVRVFTGRDRFQRSFTRPLLAVFFIVYDSIRDPGVDLWGHFAGLAAGLILGIISVFVQKVKNR